MTERELNDIVRDGIKNHFIWVNVYYNLYKDNPNAPWRETFTAVATALTSFRQKGFDPYNEAKSGPTIDSTVAANSANTFPSKQGQGFNKRPAEFTRDNSGRFRKQQKTNSSIAGFSIKSGFAFIADAKSSKSTAQRFPSL